MTLLGAPPILALLAGANDNLLQAPWTAAQVENLNVYQKAGYFHPFTCGRRDQHRDNPGVLVAAVDGWHCPAGGCDYVQSWAHSFMADMPAPLIRAMQERQQQMARLRAIADGPRPCLLHEDIHPHHGADCMRFYAEYLMNHHLGGRAARDAYVLEVEQRILNQLVRQHAPAAIRRLNPALSK
ncbi:hypothetical protein ABZ619_39220 [Streptomyces sp. NPDC007851]|uniref:hypothetical protein n=1 Tax=Streptomyces sp. NPDC007851 TaxID=3155008 RepID=UPI00340D5E3C